MGYSNQSFMKTNYTISLCLLLAAVACSSFQEEPVNTELFKSAADEVFYATLEQGGVADVTKVYADENLKVLWNAGDHITIFNRYTYGREYAFQGVTGDTAGALRWMTMPNLSPGILWNISMPSIRIGRTTR